MLETIKSELSKESVSFEERYIDYVVSIENQSILDEMRYIRKHNKLDILKLDKLLDLEFEEAIEDVKRKTNSNCI